MKLKLAVPMTFLLCCSFAIAHGENQPGPHGGEIRMPGAYHVELVPLKAGQLKIFLLDISFKNPTVQDSEVDVEFVGKENSKSHCDKVSDAFVCTFDPAIDWNSKGKLLVTSTRNHQRGGVVEYSTPFKKLSHER